MKLVLVLAMLFSTIGYSEEFSVDASKAIIVDGVISHGNVLPLGKELINRSNAKTDNKKEVQLIINSPGGEVVTGFLFINLMEAARANGLKITCIVPTVAASMAYQIFIHCDERHVLSKAFLLWHRARVSLGGGFLTSGVQMTGPELSKQGRELEVLDASLFREIREEMTEVPEKTLRYHFESETLHTGVDVHKMAPNFVTAHEAIPGLFEALMNKKTLRSQSNESDEFIAGSLIYIHEMFIGLNLNVPND